MVKRDRLLQVLIWMPGMLVVLGFMLYLAILWIIFFSGLSLPLLLKGLLGMVFSLLFLPQLRKSALKIEEGKQWRRVEALRMNFQKARPCEMQPEANEVGFPLPVLLTARLSSPVLLGLAVCWLALVSIALFIKEVPLDTLGGHIAILFFWLIMGWLLIGMIGVLMSQRIEATEHALLVRRGLRSNKIRWEQIRLFAAIRLVDKNRAMPEQYELSSEQVILRWPSSYPPGGGWVTYPREKADYEQCLTALLAYIQARTDLPLLDLC